ncbi:hypothetical protein ACAF76_018845 [Brevibacillus sp. TJ4]|uniref:hypothetical protein n=1 Tax=Brevibacillus sp. TJ4 TaxID=3234853 RepID=UPI0037D2B707
MWLIVCLALLFSGAQTVHAETELPGAAQVELFDTNKQKVVQTFANSSLFQKQAKEILDSVSGRVQELSPSLENAMIAKIPLAPPQRMVHKGTGLDVEIAEMFVVMPKKGSRPPWLILITKEHETVIMEFSRKVDALRKQLRLS